MPYNQELLVAARKGDQQRIAYYLNQGADLEARDKDEETPLLQVVRSRKLGAVQMLLEKGADIHAKNKVGTTAFLLTILYYPSEEIMQLLQKYGANFDSAFHEAAYFGDINLFQQHIMGHKSIKSAVKILDRKNNTPLMYAAANGQMLMVQWLLQQGAALTERNNHGHTALLFAAGNGQLATVQWLLQNGATLTERDSHGNIAIDWIAEKAAQASDIKYATELWQQGAKMESIVKGLLQWEGLKNRQQLLNTLLNTDDIQFKQKLIHALIQAKQPLSIIAILKTNTDKASLLIYQVPLNSRQAQAWLMSPALRDWYLLAHSLKSTLTLDIYIKIASLLTAQILSHMDLRDLLLKMSFYVLYKKPLLNDLDQYLSQWWIAYRNNAVKLKEDCKSSTTANDLVNRLKVELKLISLSLTSDQETYYQLLLKYCDKKQSLEQLAQMQNQLAIYLKQIIPLIKEAPLLTPLTKNTRLHIKEVKQTAQQQLSTWNSPFNFFNTPNDHDKQYCQILSMVNLNSASSLETTIELLQVVSAKVTR